MRSFMKRHLLLVTVGIAVVLAVVGAIWRL